MSERTPVETRIEDLEQQLLAARFEQAGRPADVGGVLEDVDGNRPVLSKDADLYFERQRTIHELATMPGLPLVRVFTKEFSDENAGAGAKQSSVGATERWMPGVRSRVDLVTSSEQEDITQSFERPVVAIHPMSKANRLGMLIDDIRDNMDYAFPPQAVEYSGPDAAKLTERFLPQEAIDAIRRIGQHYDRKIFRRIDIVGDKESGTNHPHIYFLDRTIPGKTRMFFVDPEDKVAVNDKLRPSIANLVGIEVPDDDTEPSRVAVLRYRMPKYEHGVKQEGRGPDELRAVIAEVIDNEGFLPEILSGDEENQVLFMIAGDSLTSRVQARYSSKRQIESFARGGRGSSALEGKVLMQAHVVNKLIRLFNHPSEVRELKQN